MASGVPCAMTTPKFSTTIRSHTDMTRSMWCSTRSTAIVAVRPRMREPSELISLSDSPLAGSSSSNSCGSAIERACQRGLLLHGIGQGGGQPVRVRRNPEPVKDLHRPRRGSALFVARAPQPEKGGDRIAVQHRLGAEHHVLADGQPGAQPDGLQGAGDAEFGQVMRVVPAQIAAAVGEAAGARVDEPADDVEQRRLARAVRADHPDHLARHDRHRDVVEREDPAEADGDAVHGQDRFTSRAPASAGSAAASRIGPMSGTYAGTEVAGARPGRAPKRACLPAPRHRFGRYNLCNTSASQPRGCDEPVGGLPTSSRPTGLIPLLLAGLARGAARLWATNP